MAPVPFLILNALRTRGMIFYVGDTGKVFILLSSSRSVVQRTGRINSGRFGPPGRRRPRWRAVWAAGSSAAPSGGASLILGGRTRPGHRWRSSAGEMAAGWLLARLGQGLLDHVPPPLLRSVCRLAIVPPRPCSCCSQPSPRSTYTLPETS
jgi:hypothetical protein